MPSIVRRWAPRAATVYLDEPYIAVHLNLDCDWMLVGSGNGREWKRYAETADAGLAARIAQQHCSRPKPHHDPQQFFALNRARGGARWAYRHIPAYVKAVAEIRRRPGAES